MGSTVFSIIYARTIFTIFDTSFFSLLVTGPFLYILSLLTLCSLIGLFAEEVDSVNEIVDSGCGASRKSIKISNPSEGSERG